jgi:hypothetical protein
MAGKIASGGEGARWQQRGGVGHKEASLVLQVLQVLLLGDG